MRHSLLTYLHSAWRPRHRPSLGISPTNGPPGGPACRPPTSPALPKYGAPDPRWESNATPVCTSVPGHGAVRCGPGGLVPSVQDPSASSGPHHGCFSAVLGPFCPHINHRDIRISRWEIVFAPLWVHCPQYALQSKSRRPLCGLLGMNETAWQIVNGRTPPGPLTVSLTRTQSRPP